MAFSSLSEKRKALSRTDEMTGQDSSASLIVPRSPASEPYNNQFNVGETFQHLNGQPRQIEPSTRKNKLFQWGPSLSSKELIQPHSKKTEPRHLASLFQRAAPTREMSHEGTWGGWFTRRHHNSHSPPVDSGSQLLPSSSSPSSSSSFSPPWPAAGREKIKLKGKILRQKLLKPAYRWGAYFQDDDPPGYRWDIPTPTEFAIPAIEHIRLSLIQHRLTCGPGEPRLITPPSQSDLVEFARQYQIDEEVLNRWIYVGARCWLSFQFQINEILEVQPPPISGPTSSQGSPRPHWMSPRLLRRRHSLFPLSHLSQNRSVSGLRRERIVSMDPTIPVSSVVLSDAKPNRRYQESPVHFREIIPREATAESLAVTSNRSNGCSSPHRIENFSEALTPKASEYSAQCVEPAISLNDYGSSSLSFHEYSSNLGSTKDPLCLRCFGFHRQVGEMCESFPPFISDTNCYNSNNNNNNILQYVESPLSSGSTIRMKANPGYIRAISDLESTQREVFALAQSSRVSTSSRLNSHDSQSKETPIETPRRSSTGAEDSRQTRNLNTNKVDLQLMNHSSVKESNLIPVVSSENLYAQATRISNMRELTQINSPCVPSMQYSGRTSSTVTSFCSTPCSNSDHSQRDGCCPNRRHQDRLLLSHATKDHCRQDSRVHKSPQDMSPVGMTPQSNLSSPSDSRRNSQENTNVTLRSCPFESPNSHLSVSQRAGLQRTETDGLFDQWTQEVPGGSPVPSHLASLNKKFDGFPRLDLRPPISVYRETVENEMNVLKEESLSDSSLFESSQAASEKGDGERATTRSFALREKALELYRKSRTIRGGGARRWDEWGFCWIARRYSLSLHCTTGTVILSLELPEHQLLAAKRDSIQPVKMPPLQISRIGTGKEKQSTDNKLIPEKPLKSLKLEALENIERIVNLETYENRRDVIGGLACIAMAVDRTRQLEGAKRGKNKTNKKRKTWKIWRKAKIWAIGSACRGRSRKVLQHNPSDSLFQESCRANRNSQTSSEQNCRTNSSHPQHNYCDTDDYNLVQNDTEPGNIEQDMGDETLNCETSYSLTRDCIFYDDTQEYRRFLALKFYGAPHCLVLAFDSASSCDEFLLLLNLLKDFRQQRPSIESPCNNRAN